MPYAPLASIRTETLGWRGRITPIAL